MSLALLWRVSPLLHRCCWQNPAPPGAAAAIQRLSPKARHLPVFSLATWVMAIIERRPIAAYGLRAQRRVRNFLAGLVWGVALLSLLVFALLRPRTAGLRRAPALLAKRARYAVIWFAGFLLVGLLRGVRSARGFVQFTLSRGLRGSTAGCSARRTPMRSASGPRLFHLLLLRLPPSHEPGRVARRAVLRRAHRHRLLSSACGAPDRCGGQSASMPPGTGRSRSSTASPTAEPCSRAICSRPTPSDGHPSVVEPPGRRAASSCCLLSGWPSPSSCLRCPAPPPATPRPIGSTELNNKGPKARYIRADGPRYPLRRPERSAPKARAIRAEGPSYPLRRPDAIRSEGPSYPLRRPELSAPTKALAICAEGPRYPRRRPAAIRAEGPRYLRRRPELSALKARAILAWGKAPGSQPENQAG